MQGRDFLKPSGTVLGGSWISLGMPTILATASVTAMTWAKWLKRVFGIDKVN